MAFDEQQEEEQFASDQSIKPDSRSADKDGEPDPDNLVKPLTPQAKEKQTKAERLASLIRNFRRRTISLEEHAELNAWILESGENERLFEKLVRRSREDTMRQDLEDRYGFERDHIRKQNQRLVRIIIIITFLLLFAVFLVSWLLIRRSSIS